MTSRQDFGPKKLGEQLLLTFEFISDLAAGETLATPSVVCTVWSGTDASPSSMISGAPSISGSQVKQLVINGVVGVVYYLTCTVNTSLGQILVQTGYLAVITNVP